MLTMHTHAVMSSSLYVSFSKTKSIHRSTSDNYDVQFRDLRNVDAVCRFPLEHPSTYACDLKHCYNFHRLTFHEIIYFFVFFYVYIFLIVLKLLIVFVNTIILILAPFPYLQSQFYSQVTL